MGTGNMCAHTNLAIGHNRVWAGGGRDLVWAFPRRGQLGALHRPKGPCPIFALARRGIMGPGSGHGQGQLWGIAVKLFFFPLHNEAL